MKTQVELQEPFSYSLIPIIILGVIVFGYAIYLIISGILKRKKEKAPVVYTEPPKIEFNIDEIKIKYLKLLDEIDAGLVQGELSVKNAYQKMSSIIRHFVFEVTGIKVQNYTLLDIQMLGIPMLETLIAEFYYPEFSGEEVSGEEYTDQMIETCDSSMGVNKSCNDARMSLQKTKRTIEIWR